MFKECRQLPPEPLHWFPKPQNPMRQASALSIPSSILPWQLCTFDLVLPRQWPPPPILSEDKPAQSEFSICWQKHPKASASMTVCDNRSDSFSITTSALALCEKSVFVSTTRSYNPQRKIDSGAERGGGVDLSAKSLLSIDPPLLVCSFRCHLRCTWGCRRERAALHPHMYRIPTATIWPFLPSRERSAAQKGGEHISQARAQGLFWFDFFFLVSSLQ